MSVATVLSIHSAPDVPHREKDFTKIKVITQVSRYMGSQYKGSLTHRYFNIQAAQYMDKSMYR